MATVHFTPTAKLMNLLTSADPKKQYNIRIASSTRLSLTTDNFQPVCEIDLPDERIIWPNGGPVETAKLRRKSGEYYFEIGGVTVRCESVRSLLSNSLSAIEKQRPGTLEKLATVKGRSKRIVSRDRYSLFHSREMAEKFSATLDGGWWYGTNNSALETNTWLKRASELAGLRWGKDFSTSL
jgi:hypothetical protein